MGDNVRGNHTRQIAAGSGWIAEDRENTSRAPRDRFVVRNLGVGFRTPSGVVPVVSGLSLEAAPGKIIVIHDGHHRSPTSDRSYAIDATRQVIDGLSAQGYTFGSLCQVQNCSPGIS